MLNDGKFSYISLFSSAGVGCHGFKLAGFECIATNEIIERRLNIQKLNNKCKFETGYISGDITKGETKAQIYSEIKRWDALGNDEIDVIIATPPCQGMSVANHKKNKEDINRNSLINESVFIIKDIKPKIFIFENVATFWTTGCHHNNTIVPIGEMITSELGDDYYINNQRLNLKNYGSNSSRTRTIVIGVRKDVSEKTLPIELFPTYKNEKTLFEVIGDLEPLEWGEYSKNDFYHSFRTYPERMRSWISNLSEGQSAFDNKSISEIPHQIKDGRRVINKNKNGDKYTRQRYDKVGPCIHTRNDQLASQNTVHPKDDRVFSIRELMRLMTIPYNFKWHDLSLEELNQLSLADKNVVSKKTEMNIRQSIGEAVPTMVMFEIANNIARNLGKESMKLHEIEQQIEKYSLSNPANMIKFIEEKKNILSRTTLFKIIELANVNRGGNSAFFTDPVIAQEVIKYLPNFDKDEIYILEPSVGAGNFLPLLFKKYDYVKKVNLVLIDIDTSMLDIVKTIFASEIPENFRVSYHAMDFMDYTETKRFDLIVGNPPFTKVSGAYHRKISDLSYNNSTKNISSYFLEKSTRISDYIALIMPKNVLNTPEFSLTRDYLLTFGIDTIIDFGEMGFKGVLIETIAIFIDTKKKKKRVKVISVPRKTITDQNISYISDKEYPYWIIYRSKDFDNIARKMKFNVFHVFRDRQITKKNSTTHYNDQSIRVLKSRNISDSGEEIINIEGYDSYILPHNLESLAISKFLNRDDVYLTPNMTYNPRILKKEKGYVVNGSVAILIPKTPFELSESQRAFLSSEEYRAFYRIARNYQTRSLNIDKSSVFWFGLFDEEFDNEE